MNNFGFRVLIIGLIAACVYTACRKTDQTVNVNSKEDKTFRFFKEKQSDDPLVQAITQFALRENKKNNYVENLIAKIGYPQWNRAITIAGASAAKQGRNADDSVAITYVPFVRDSQQYVNATLAVATAPGDTTVRILCDWQYSDTAATGLTKAQFALTLMNLDRSVFGNRLYQLTDTTIFAHEVRYIQLNPVQNNRALSSGRSSLLEWLYTYTICWTDYVPINNGQVVGCAPGPNCPFYTAQESCIEISWTSGGGGGTGGGSGPIGGTGSGGNGSGGGWVPPNNPNPCGGGVASRTEVQEGCGVGWVPRGGGGGTLPPPPNDSTVAANLKKLLLKAIIGGNNIPDSLHNKAQQDSLERTFTFVRSGTDTIVSWIRSGATHNSSPMLNSHSFAFLHTHQEDDPVGGSDRNQCFDGPDIYKLYKNAGIDEYPIDVSIITTRDYYYAAVIVDINKFKSFIRNLCNSTQLTPIYNTLNNLHIDAMDSCTTAGCTWQKKTEKGVLSITANNNSAVSGIKIFRSPRQNINFTILTL
jgi:hypothetical protein